MNLKDCIITFDALHTQRETVEIIKDQKGHYVGGLKGNQGNLQQEASLYFDDECKNFYKEKGDFYETVEKAHGKIERRSYYLVKAHQSAEVKKWKGLKGFVCFINKMVLSLCKLAKPIVGTPSIRILRKCFGWNYLEYTAQLLSCFDEETIKNAMQIQK